MYYTNLILLQKREKNGCGILRQTMTFPEQVGSKLKLFIQIPCHNEETSLPITIASLPKVLPFINEIQFLIIDDGSTDRTVEIAQESGVDFIVKMSHHVGLAGGFVAGLDACLANGADIIVNTDADNQYNADDIEKLIEPILEGRADIVVGDRGVSSLSSFSPGKRFLQRIGSWIISKASGVNTPDATSGFRALSRDAAMRTIVLSNYSYTLETLIQAGSSHLSVVYIPVRTNAQTRPSRLMKSIPHYVMNSSVTILRAYTMYRPLRVFSLIGALFLLIGIGLSLRFIYFLTIGQGNGHIQSVILSAVLLIIGFQILLIGLLADLIGSNRKILEELLLRVRKIEFQSPDNHTSVKNKSNSKP